MRDAGTKPDGAWNTARASHSQARSMSVNEISRQKPVVAYLNIGPKTAKRVAWEDWSFTVVGPFQIEVTNESYGHLKDEHTYRVTVEERDDVIVPAECECPADRFRDEYDCKHKVALAAIGGPLVLEAARDYQPASEPTTAPERVTTAADKLRTDGGEVDAVAEGGGRRRSETDSCPHGQDGCDGPEDELPCFACWCEQQNREEVA